MQNDPRQAEPLLLGIDTGGTYTDAVLYRETEGVVAKAKALTTRHDLSIGIAGAVDAVLARGAAEAQQIGLVSVSTTLATNALVEGQGTRAGLVMVGFDEHDLDRDGLRAALGDDPVLFLHGGHDGHGNETPLDLAPLDRWLETHGTRVAAFAVCGYFAVLNPAHENAVFEALRARAGLPVTMSHELSSRLGGPRRALTTLLNARLIALVDRLIAATTGFLELRGITAPLTVVLGDGALVSATLARSRPIETILSGPAASLVGARRLTGLEDAIVSDIGGTTTDVALLTGGRPRLDPDGAMVGGHRTMVQAVAVRTHGLGGDSEVTPEPDALDGGLALGPRRLVPLSLSETLEPESIVPELQRQLRQDRPERLDGRFARASGLPDHLAMGLSSAETSLYRRLDGRPRPLDRLLNSNQEQATLRRLVARGLVQMIGFTPSDAAHVVGRQATWNAEAARLGAALLARRRDGRGQPLASDALAFSERVLALLGRRSAEAILETALAEDGLGEVISPAHPIFRRAMAGQGGVVNMRLALDRPVIGLGASARLHYAGLDKQLGSACILPEHLDVASAVGAVAGQVRATVEARVSQPREGLFRASAGAKVRDFASREEAIAFAEDETRALAVLKAKAAGADRVELASERDMRIVDVDGQEMFVEATIRATAAGRPRIAG